MLDHGVVVHLLWLLEKGEIDDSFRKIIIWLMSNLCHSKERPPPLHYVKLMLPTLLKFLEHENVQILVDVCRTLSNVTLMSREIVRIVKESGFVQRIVQLLDHENRRIVSTSLCTIVNIVSLDKPSIDLALKAKLLLYLPKLMTHGEKSIVKAAVWVLGNLVGGE